MGNNFRTSTPMGDWRSFKFTHAEAGVTYEEGKLYMIQETVGLLFTDISYDSSGCKEAATRALADECVLVYHIEKVIVYKLAKTGWSFLPGDKVYWNGVQGDPVSPVYRSGYYWIGIATEPAAALATTVEIDLKGDKATAGE